MGADVCGVDLLFDQVEGEKVRGVLRATMGGCPCERGGGCPLLPADLSQVLNR